MNALIGAVMAILALVEGVLGIRTSEEPKFESIMKQGVFEIRAYPELLIAKTTSSGTQDETSNRNFTALAGYIFGKNKQNETIGMTAPVYLPEGMKGNGEQIGMTAPVLQNKTADGKYEMIFIMPSRYERSTLPEPQNPEVELGTLPARTVATIRFSGRSNADVIARKSRQLQTWIDQQGYEAQSEPVPAFYDPPFTIPFLRRNEIHIEVSRPRP